METQPRHSPADSLWPSMGSRMHCRASRCAAEDLVLPTPANKEFHSVVPEEGGCIQQRSILRGDVTLRARTHPGGSPMGKSRLKCGFLSPFIASHRIASHLTSGPVACPVIQIRCSGSGAPLRPERLRLRQAGVELGLNTTRLVLIRPVENAPAVEKAM